MIVEAGASYLVSIINCSHFWLKNYEVFFTYAKIAYSRHMIEWFGTAHNTPADIILNILVLQLPDVF